MPSITIPWTLEIIGNTVGTNALGKKSGFVAEFDCELTFNYWGEYRYDEVEWELDYVAVDGVANQRHIITAESDPQLWAVLQRAMKADNLKLSDRIIEAIGEDMDNARYEYEAAE